MEDTNMSRDAQRLTSREADPGRGVLNSMFGRIIASAIPLVLLLAVANASFALTISTAAISFPGVGLDGTDKTVDGSTTAWQADATGETGGWHVTVSSTDFIDAGKVIDVSNFEIRLLDTDIAVVSGDPTGPSSTQTAFAALSVTPLKIASAASGNGDGVYDLTPGFRLTVPAEALTGTYTATVTVDIAAGP